MTKHMCDKCGQEIVWETGNAGWQIGLKFYSWWNPKGDERVISLCGSCGWKAARLLGFQYDTGKILSLARKESITDVTVYGAHGGGLGDIAMTGVHSAGLPSIAVGVPDAPVAGAMQIEEEA